MIVLITDFGLDGPYIGQMISVLYRIAPATPVVNLFADAPAHNPRATAYLLAAYAPYLPPESIFLCVVDPGVGSGVHQPVIVRAHDQWFVGPANGLFTIIAKRAREFRCWAISWRPERLSDSFHGRDLYAPVAARLAKGEPPMGEPLNAKMIAEPWPDDLYEVIYIDHFGNAITGIRASVLSKDRVLKVNGQSLKPARTFADVEVGQAFWYENANGLIELAVNQGRADALLGIRVSDPIILL
jgi:S-adenosyl-L-methionine hydrolase (adenosine-forming)